MELGQFKRSTIFPQLVNRIADDTMSAMESQDQKMESFFADLRQHLGQQIEQVQKQFFDEKTALLAELGGTVGSFGLVVQQRSVDEHERGGCDFSRKFVQSHHSASMQKNSLVETRPQQFVSGHTATNTGPCSSGNPDC